jgi:hypothetical protein
MCSILITFGFAFSFSRTDVFYCVQSPEQKQDLLKREKYYKQIAEQNRRSMRLSSILFDSF